MVKSRVKVDDVRKVTTKKGGPDALSSMKTIISGVKREADRVHSFIVLFLSLSLSFPFSLVQILLSIFICTHTYIHAYIHICQKEGRQGTRT